MSKLTLSQLSSLLFHTERQVIVDDVMRPECLRRPDGQAGYASRFFLLAGRKAAMQRFMDGRINGAGLNPRPKFIDGFLPKCGLAELRN